MHITFLSPRKISLLPPPTSKQFQYTHLNPFPYLSLCIFASRTVGSEEVLLVEVLTPQLPGFEVPDMFITDRDAPECFNLHPAHEVLCSIVLIEEDL